MPLGKHARTFAMTTAAILLSVTLTATPALADTTDVNPPGANDFTCVPSAIHPYPVVLVNGTAETMIKNWVTLSPTLKNAGYCVFSLNYGVVNGVPAMAPMQSSARELSRFIDGVLGATGAKKVDLVGHSQGGLMPRYYLKYLNGAAKVHALVGIAPINHGTEGSLKGFGRLALPEVPSVGAPSTDSSAANDGETSETALSQMSAGSAFLTDLNKDGDTERGVFYTTIATIYDEIVTPYTSQALAGNAKQVTNVVIQDHCALNPIEHDQAPNDRVVQQFVLAALSVKNGPLSASFSPVCL